MTMNSIDPKPPILLRENAIAQPMSWWQRYFESIYQKKNAEIKLKFFSNNSIAFIRGYAIAHISQDLGNVGEQIREGGDEGNGKPMAGKYQRYIGSLFAWLLALASESKIELQDVTWKKYPGVCAYCHEPKDCAEAWWTISQKEKDKKPAPAVEEKTEPPPGNLDGWLEVWSRIYGRKVRGGLELHDIMYKLYEELGEILDAYNEHNFEDVKSELPDFLSWLLDLIIKLRQYGFIGENDKPSIILYEKFRNGCPSCKSPNECKCTLKWI